MKLSLSQVIDFNCLFCNSNLKTDLISISLIMKNDHYSYIEEMYTGSCIKDNNNLYFNLWCAEDGEGEVLESMGILKLDIATNIIDITPKKISSIIESDEDTINLSGYSISSYRTICKCLDFNYFFVKNNLGNFNLQNVTYDKNDAGINYMYESSELSIKRRDRIKMSKPKFVKTFNTIEKIQNYVLMS